MEVNQYVVIVGWGSELVSGKSVPFGIALHNLGPDWGEKGYFRIRRGTNECGIESMALAFKVLP